MAVAVPPEPDRAHGALVTVPSDTVTVPLGEVDPLTAATLMPTETAELDQGRDRACRT